MKSIWQKQDLWQKTDKSMQGYLFKLASIGGTFGSLHDGHKEYIDLAFSLAKNVQIGVNDSEYAQTTKSYKVASVESRLKELAAYLAKQNYSDRATFVMYRKKSGFHAALLNPEIDCVVILDEYHKDIKNLNRRRVQKGMLEYHIHIKPRTLLRGEDLSSTKLLAL